MSYSPTPERPLGAGAHAMHPSGSIDLSEMFGELKHELEELKGKLNNAELARLVAEIKHIIDEHNHHGKT